jgi:molybdopterin-containing oxidoreductase family membrane subunit
MWFERFVIIVTSLHRDYLLSSWDYFTPTWVDILTFLGSLGLFLTMFLLFMRFLPMVAIAEIKGVADEHSRGHDDADAPNDPPPSAPTVSDGEPGEEVPP